MTATTALLLTHATATNVLLGLLIFFVCSVFHSYLRRSHLPKSLPYVGYGTGFVASLQNTIGVFKHTDAWIKKGYNEYNKQGKSFVFPSFSGLPSVVLMPPETIPWIMSQPEDILSQHEFGKSFIHYKYSAGYPAIMEEAWVTHVLSKNLTRNIGDLIPELDAEIQHSGAQVFGDSQQGWHDVNLMNALEQMINILSIRSFCSELCRDKVYLSATSNYSNAIVAHIFAFPLIPDYFHPLVGLFSCLPSKYFIWQANRRSLPIIKDRLVQFQRMESGHPEYKRWKPPNDFMTWQILTAKAEGRTDHLDPWVLGAMMLPLSFAAINTTVVNGLSILLHILSDPKLLEVLREEAAIVYAEDGNVWTSKGLARLTKLDSALVEISRYDVTTVLASPRKVVAKAGLTGLDGTHYPYGTIMSIAWAGLAMDEREYDQPHLLNPFRHSSSNKAVDNSTEKEVKHTSFVTTGRPNFLFGMGRQACPGRFFVSAELKILFTYLFLHYDFKQMEKPAEKLHLGWVSVPALNARVSLRRRDKPWTVGDS